MAYPRASVVVSYRPRHSFIRSFVPIALLACLLASIQPIHAESRPAIHLSHSSISSSSPISIRRMKEKQKMNTKKIPSSLPLLLKMSQISETGRTPQPHTSHESDPPINQRAHHRRPLPLVPFPLLSLFLFSLALLPQQPGAKMPLGIMLDDDLLPGSRVVVG